MKLLCLTQTGLLAVDVYLKPLAQQVISRLHFQLFVTFLSLNCEPALLTFKLPAANVCVWAEDAVVT